jgi:DNA-binding transcriptional MerR regulator
LNDDLAAMIPQQLDLFGGAPKPPKKIRVEEEQAPPPSVLEEKPAVLPEEAVESEKMESLSDSTEAMNADNAMVADASEPEPVEEGETVVDEIVSQLASSAVEHENHEPVAAEIENAFSVEEPKMEVEPDPIHVETPEEATATPDLQPAADLEVPSQLNIPPDEILFKRQYYSMGETAAMFDITHSMLRYWENEFDILQPRKNKKGDRYFRPADIKNLQLIYHLIRVRKFTLDGAREYLRNHNKALDTFELVQRLEKVQAFLNELKAHL